MYAALMLMLAVQISRCVRMRLIIVFYVLITRPVQWCPTELKCVIIIYFFIHIAIVFHVLLINL